ncbi:MAG TPA: class I SAM-dependent methyltransferase [Candidatus Limnocylindrales bacterium]|nr:class I SAM-dependent methyltransferase [Candidatus Limnocylindrales bacterium]
MAGVYDSTRWSGVPPEVMKSLLNAMKELFAGCRTVLDVGIGTGRFAEYVSNSGFDVVGIDVSLSMMAKAREKRVRNLVQADAHYLPFRDRVFDGGIMVHVLHLVRDWVQVVREAGRVTGKRVVAEVEGGEGFNPRSRYLELRKEMGYPLDRFNDGEAGLRRVVPPASVKLVGDYWTDIDVHEEIDSFDKRKSSVSWDVPAEVNDRIIQRLHSENPEKTIRRREIVEVVGWDPAQFRNFAARERSRT